MIQVEVPYGEVCPNKNIKVKYDVCKECGRYKTLSKTFVTCHLNNQTLQMTKEQKELLLKDLCARLPYGIAIYRIEDSSIHRFQYSDITENMDQFSHFLEYSGIDDIKPYLRPISSMTEEEAEEYNGLLYGVCDFTQDSSSLTPVIKLTTFFYSHHLDCCGLIEKGLALEAPEDMYK